MKRFKRILKIIGYTAAGVFVVLLLLAGFTQTPYFKDRLRVILVSEISTKLNGSLKVGTISGNFLTGFSVDSIEIYYGEDIVLSIAKMTCDYDVFKLPEKYLKLNTLIIEQPIVHFSRSMGGDWNINKVFKSSADTTRSEFNWTLSFQDVQVKNAGFTLTDSTTLTDPEQLKADTSYVNYHHFSVKDLNMQFSALIKRNSFNATVKHANFYSEQPQFELSHLAGIFAVNEKGLSAKNVILQSSHSYLEIDAKLRVTDIFKGFDITSLQHDSTQLQFRAKNIDFAELKSFLSPVSFLNGSAFVDLDAAGEFGNLNIKRLNVQTRSSSLKMAGSVHNLHQPSDLYLDLFAGDSRIEPSDAAKLLPTFNLPKFKEIGPVAIVLQYVGKPLDFKTTTTLDGIFGKLEIVGHLNLTSTQPRYEVTFSSDKLNIGALTDNRDLTSSVSGRGELTGTGTVLDSINARFKLEIDSARIHDIDVGNSQLYVNAFPHRFESVSFLNSGGTNASLTAKIDFADPHRPTYGAEVSLNAVDLSRILENKKFKTNLNLRAKLTGSGKTIHDLGGDATISLLPSTINQYKLSEQEIRLRLDQHEATNKRLSLLSSIADAEIGGKFDLDLIPVTLDLQITNLLDAIIQHTSTTDTVIVLDGKKYINKKHRTAGQREMDFTYDIKVKDLEAVSSILTETPFNAQGEFKGTVKGSDEQLSLSCNGIFDEFFIGTIQEGILLHHGKLASEIKNISSDRTLEHLSININLDVSSGAVNTTALDSIHCTLQYERPKGYLTLKGKVDSTYKLTMSGQTSIQPHTYVFDVETLSVGANDYMWSNQNDVQVRFNSDGIRILHALLKRNNESFSLSGILRSNGDYEIDGDLQKFDLLGLSVLSRNPKLSRRSIRFEGIANAAFRLSGTTQSPIIAVHATGEDLFYKQTRIGSVNAMIDYKDQQAMLDAKVDAGGKDTLPSLTISGTLPINLALSGVTERFPNKQQNLHITSEGFDLGVLEPLFAEFENLSGKVMCNLTMAGTPRAPEYLGHLSIKDARFTFVPNNVAYIVSGNLEPSREKISLRNFIIKNVPDDKVIGEMQVKGDLTLKNFQVESFDFLLNGKLLFMNEATRKTISTMYGKLFAETDQGGLNLKGSLEHPYMSGKLFVRDANLVFPPTKETATAGSALTLNYILVDDTTKPNENQKIFAKRFYNVIDSGNVEQRSSAAPAELTLLDRLRYDLSVETEGPTRVRMVFTPSTNEELFAELDGKVNAVNNQGTPTIYGEIAVSPRSYYNFLKRFDATGKLKFVGPWDNPELDIKATYEGYRQTVVAKSADQKTPDVEQKPIDQKVIVQLNITGTRYEPKLEMSMKVQLEPGKEPVDWATQAKGGDVQSDAISFILTGKFRDELTAKDKENIVSNVGSSAGSSVFSGFTSTFLSGVLTDFLRTEFPFIRNAEVSYRGGNLQETADLRLSGEAFKGYWRLGGKVFNDIGNANVNYQLSLGDVFNAASIRNLFIELERKVEGSDFEERKLTNAARIYYRISF